MATISEEPDTAEEGAEKSLSNRLLVRMNHEIRGAVHVILGLTDVIRESEASPQLCGNLNVMRACAERLLKESADLIDLTKAELGGLRLASTSFNLHETLQQAMDLMSVLASCKRVTLRLQISRQAPAVVVGDSGRLSQILITLVRAAIGRLDRGEISVRVEAISTNIDETRIKFTIADNGPPIPPGKIKCMFDGDLDREMIMGGRSEVQFMLARHLARMMGGDLVAEVEPPIGAVFHFEANLRPTFKMSLSDSSRTDTKASSHPRPLRILVADDSADTQIMIRALLKDSPWGIESADNGRVALEMAMLRSYDLILMDLDMPEMNGYSAAREIRISECLNQKRAVPIVALTAHNESEAAAKSIAAGCTAHVTKPIRKAALMATIQRYAASS